jgi:hypothetical protein
LFPGCILAAAWLMVENMRGFIRYLVITKMAPGILHPYNAITPTLSVLYIKQLKKIVNNRKPTIMSIKIITQNVYGGRGQWGYSLSVNGKFIRRAASSFLGLVATNKEGATIWASLEELRRVWHLYMPTILYITSPAPEITYILVDPNDDSGNDNGILDKMEMTDKEAAARNDERRRSGSDRRWIKTYHYTS